MTEREPTIELQQSDLIFLHSPLNLLAQFVLLLEERFSLGLLPWQHDRDENKTGIFIHTEYNTPQETANAYPRIVVGRGSVVHRTDVALGDLDDRQPHLRTQEGYYHWSVGEADIQIQCVSENRGECCILGDTIQATVGMSRKEILKQFTLRSLSATNLLPVQPYKRDKEKWQVSLQFRVGFEQRWFTLPAAPLLRGITVSTATYSKNQLDALEYIKRFVVEQDDQL